jgi:hypothetical protein
MEHGRDLVAEVLMVIGSLAALADPVETVWCIAVLGGDVVERVVLAFPNPAEAESFAVGERFDAYRVVPLDFHELSVSSRRASQVGTRGL